MPAKQGDREQDHAEDVVRRLAGCSARRRRWRLPPPPGARPLLASRRYSGMRTGSGARRGSSKGSVASHAPAPARTRRGTWRGRSPRARSRPARASTHCDEHRHVDLASAGSPGPVPAPPRPGRVGPAAALACSPVHRWPGSCSTRWPPRPRRAGRSTTSSTRGRASDSGRRSVVIGHPRGSTPRSSHGRRRVEPEDSGASSMASRERSIAIGQTPRRRDGTGRRARGSSEQRRIPPRPSHQHALHHGDARRGRRRRACTRRRRAGSKNSTIQSGVGMTPTAPWTRSRRASSASDVWSSHVSSAAARSRPPGSTDSERAEQRDRPRVDRVAGVAGLHLGPLRSDDRAAVADELSRQIGRASAGRRAAPSRTAARRPGPRPRRRNASSS